MTSNKEKIDTYIDQNYLNSESVSGGIGAWADMIANAPVDDVHVGSGISSMSGLAYLCDNATLAGGVLPRMTFREVDGDNVHYWTESEQRELLYQLSYQRNRSESARNLVWNKLVKMDKFIRDETNDLTERAQAVDDIFQVGNYFSTQGRGTPAEIKRMKDALTKLFKDALKEVDDSFNELPDDLERAKKVIFARLEAKANANMKRIKNAVTQQGVDLPESCDDQANAVKEIAAIKQSAQLTINVLDTVEKVKSVYDLTVGKMADVVPLNTPDFISPDRRLITNHKYDQVGTTPFTIKIVNPSVVNSLINLEISSEGNSTHKVEYKYLNGVFLFILLTITPGTQASKVSVRARNLCGEGRKFVISVNAKA